VSGTEKMVRYSLLAGEKALETFAYEQALVHFDRVLAAKAVPEVDAESAAAHFGLARAQVATLPRHEMGQAHLNLSRAFDYYVSVGDTGQFVAISVLPFPNLLEHRLPSRRLVTRALELVADSSLEAGRLYSFQGRVQGMQDGDYQSARLSFDRALAIARRASDTVLELRTLGSAAQVEMWHNHFEDSLKSGLMAIDLCLDASDLRGEVDARYWAALASRTLGDFEGLRVQCLAMLEPAERLRDRYWLATSHSIVAYLGFSSGEWQSAREATQRGLDLMPLDPRIADACGLMRAGETAPSMDALAAHANLSASRFRHLFREQLGVSLKRYQLHLKCQRALALWRSGMNFTELAVAAGFYDQPHLNRTLRAMFDSLPSRYARGLPVQVVHLKE